MALTRSTPEIDPRSAVRQPKIPIRLSRRNGERYAK